MTEEKEGVFALQPACPGNGKDALGETLAVGRLAAEAYLSPLDREAQGTLRYIVGRLHAFMEDKGEKMIPATEQAFRASRNGLIQAGLIAQAQRFHSSPDEGGRVPQLFAGQNAIDKGVPIGEEPLDLAQHMISEGTHVGAGALVGKSNELAYDVGPTQLPYPVFVIGAIGGSVIL